MNLFKSKDKNQFLISYIEQLNAEQPAHAVNIELAKIIYQVEDTSIVREGVLWTSEFEQALELLQFDIVELSSKAMCTKIELTINEKTYKGKAYRVARDEHSGNFILAVDFNSFIFKQ